jgi:hypothetical protein
MVQNNQVKTTKSMSPVRVCYLGCVWRITCMRVCFSSVGSSQVGVAGLSPGTLYYNIIYILRTTDLKIPVLPIMTVSI